jgi:hypothetical protein
MQAGGSGRRYCAIDLGGEGGGKFNAQAIQLRGHFAHT